MAHENLLDDLLLEMLEQGLACQAQLYGQGKVLDFAFNLSLFQLTNEELLNRLITRLQRHTMSSVTFEITEDGPAVTTDNSVRAMTRLRELGVCLSMDDYGIGQSTLLRLCRLPFDEIKLAGEFTRQLYDDRHHLGIARSTVLLAHELDLQLVVEGIETEEQRRCLVQLGVQIGQGYLFAQPMRTDSLSRWLETHKLNSAV